MADKIKTTKNNEGSDPGPSSPPANGDGFTGAILPPEAVKTINVDGNNQWCPEKESPLNDTFKQQQMLLKRGLGYHLKQLLLLGLPAREGL